MVGILTGIVIGTLAGMAISAAAVIYGSVKGAPRDRAAKLQKKAYKGKISGKRLNKALVRNYNRQITALKWGRMPLMEKVNSFSYKVNSDDDFADLWEANSTTKKDKKSMKKLAICKSKIKIAELKNKKVGKWQKKRDKIIKSYGIGPMKEMGWMESMPKLGGGEFVNRVKGYGAKEGGTFVGGIDNEIRYQMAATSDDTKGYDPSDLFQKAQSQFRNNMPTTRATFKRFGVNYPITAGLVPDRFVVGNNKEMYGLSKLIILANACSKLFENKDMKKVQVIDDAADKNERVKYLTRSQFAQYASAYVNSESGKTGLNSLQKVDCEQAQAIQDTLNNYVANYKTDIEK